LWRDDAASSSSRGRFSPAEGKEDEEDEEEEEEEEEDEEE
jgi:hypothetical protein